MHVQADGVEQVSHKEPFLTDSFNVRKGLGESYIPLLYHRQGFLCFSECSEFPVCQ